MSTTIEMPKLSDTMTVGTVVKWHKNIGDKIENGDTLAEIETDKATMELENFDDGYLLKILVQEGEEAPIGGTLAIIGEQDEKVEDIPEPSPAPKAEEKEISEDGNDTDFTEDKLPDNKSEEASIVVEHKNKAGEDVGSGSRLRVSPLARKIAADKNIDLQNIQGSGPSGRIIKRDLQDVEGLEENLIKPSDRSSFEASGANFSNGLLTSKSIPVSGMRATIAKRLSESKSTIPHFYLQKEINSIPLKRAREAINFNLKKKNELLGISDFNKLSINDIVLKACAETIKWHSEINTSWANTEIIYHPEVHLAFGVAVEGGLLTPVIRNADSLSLEQISLEAKALIKKARSKKLKPDEMAGSTFTITNLGMYGIDTFSGIINPPNAAILSVGSSRQKPVVDDSGNIVAGETLILGLSCDHRLVDGAIAADFLKMLSHHLENPAAMLG